MNMPTTISGMLMLPAPTNGAHAPPGVRLAPGRLTIERATITRIEEDESLVGQSDLGGEDAIIIPGFIDAHVHLPQFDSMGIDGMTLLDWLDRVIFPAECRWTDADHAGEMALRAGRSLLSFGTTGICAYATVHHEGAKRAIESIAGLGMRAMVGQVLMDRNAPAELCRDAKRLIDEAGALTTWARDRAGPSSPHANADRSPWRVEHAITPRFAVSCTRELLAGAGSLARTLGAPVQTHLSEMRTECELVRTLFDGRSYTGVYQDAGLLGPRSIFAHAVWLDEAETSMLASSGSLVAHCPTANTFLQSGDCPRGWLEGRGVRTLLGSDIAGGTDRSMVRVARAMIEAAKRVHANADDHTPADPIPTPSEAWWRITGGNADALGWPTTSRLMPGAEADLLIVRPDIPWRSSADPLGTLMYAWDDRWLMRTIAGGHAVHHA
jgi:guanine deaminase